MGKCNKIESTCGKKLNANCVDFEGTVNEGSSLINDDCLNIAKTTQDIYDQIEQLQEDLDLSDLGSDCITYTQADPLKLKVKEALKAIEEKVCELSEALPDKNLPGYCNPIFDEIIDCVGLDYECLTDPCDNTITTLKELLQSLISKVCTLSGGELDTIEYTYQAWVDDTNSGNGFTTDPNTGSDRCYYALRTVKQLVSLPTPTNLFSDYTSSDWVRRKEPKLQYEYGYNLIEETIRIPITGSGAPINTVVPFSNTLSFDLPSEYINNSSSIGKFTLLWSFTNLNDSEVGRVDLRGTLYGQSIILTNIGGTLDTYSKNVKTEIHIAHNSVDSELNVFVHNTIGYKDTSAIESVTDSRPEFVQSRTYTIPFTLPINDVTLTIDDVIVTSNDPSNFESVHELGLHSLLVEGFNPLNTTC